MRDAFFPHVVCCACCVCFTPRDIEIASNDDSLAFGNQVPYSGIQCVEEAIAEIISGATAIGRAVDAEDDKGWEFEHHAAAFGVQKRGVYAKGVELLVREVSSNVLIVWKVAVGNR